jgi:hypothetical protein
VISRPEDPDELELYDNPYILSDKIAVGPNSFVDFRQNYDRKCPPPKYFTKEILLTPLPTKKSDILKGLDEMPMGGLVCTDEEAMER